MINGSVPEQYIMSLQHYEFSRTTFTKAHNSRISCLALTLDGRFLATATCKGILIRVFNTSDGLLPQEVLGFLNRL